eukprot:IDg17547t1
MGHSIDSLTLCALLKSASTNNRRPFELARTNSHQIYIQSLNNSLLIHEPFCVEYTDVSKAHALCAASGHCALSATCALSVRSAFVKSTRCSFPYTVRADQANLSEIDTSRFKAIPEPPLKDVMDIPPDARTDIPEPLLKKGKVTTAGESFPFPITKAPRQQSDRICHRPAGGT